MFLGRDPVTMSSEPDHHHALPVLGSFLRDRRLSLSQADVGLNVPEPSKELGLTRQEVAQLADISVAYLVRLEEGSAIRASVAALQGLARALKLDDDDRDQLFRLAQTPQVATHRREPPTEHVAIGMAQLLNAMTDVPAVVLGCRDDVLAWNRLGHRLLAPHLPFEAPLALEARPNRIKMVFLDPHMRTTYLDWETEARRSVTQLHELTVARPEDLALMRLIGDLVVASDQFAEYWADPKPAAPTRGVRHLHHSEVGDLDLNYEILTVEGNDQRLLTHCAEPGSVSEARLHDLLALVSS